jgi:catechol 2,3-dioxygenase-like lactoylglutathione lyase family enzyme
MKRIATVTVIVKDYDEAIEFYTQKLNFKLIEDQKIGEEIRWVLVVPDEQNSVALLLEKAKTEAQKLRIGNQTGGSVFMILNTDNFEKEYQNLLEKKVNIVRDRSDETYGKVCVFSDLYGNLWDLIEPKML